MGERIFIALLGNLFGAVALALLLAWVLGAQGPDWANCGEVRQLAGAQIYLPIILRN